MAEIGNSLYTEMNLMLLGDNNFATFVDGVWLEERGVLGILDTLGSIYLLGTDGRKIMRVTLKQLKIFSPTIGLIASKDSSL